MIRVFTSRTQKTGKIGEDIALKYLGSKGYVSRETNYSTRFGEIDIIAEKNRMLYFIEVKTVSCETFNTHESFYLPEYNFPASKLQKIGKSASIYIQKQYKYDVSHETFFNIGLICVILEKSTGKSFVRFYDSVV